MGGVGVFGVRFRVLTLNFRLLRLLLLALGLKPAGGLEVPGERGGMGNKVGPNGKGGWKGNG